MVFALLGLQFDNVCDSMYNESLRVVFEKYITGRIYTRHNLKQKKRNMSLKDESSGNGNMNKV